MSLSYVESLQKQPCEFRGTPFIDDDEAPWTGFHGEGAEGSALWLFISCCRRRRVPETKQQYTQHLVTYGCTTRSSLPVDSRIDLAFATSSAEPWAMTRNLSDFRAVSYLIMLSLGIPRL